MPRIILSRTHAAHRGLYEELHARPFPQLDRSVSIAHMAVLRGDHSRDAELRHLHQLFDHFRCPQPDWSRDHYIVRLGPVELRLERHTEFTTYTFFRYEADQPFTRCAMEVLPEAWLAELPGSVISLVHLGIERVDTLQETRERAGRYFGSERLIASHVIDRTATVWTSLQLDEHGFSRYLIQDLKLTPCRSGRLVQRLIEIETYRQMAMLSLPLAREVLPRIAQIDARLGECVSQLNALRGVEEERQLLNAITELAVENEDLHAQTAHRFGASQAYERIYRERLEELRECDVDGFQMLSEFLLRRSTPARRTCESAAKRMHELSYRIDKATDLLRTRVNLNLQSQNQQILASMDRRAHYQLRLQETVEGLSVVAISYYAVGLLKHSFVFLKEAGLPLNSGLLTGLSIPLVLYLVWRGMKQVRRQLAAA